MLTSSRLGGRSLAEDSRQRSGRDPRLTGPQRGGGAPESGAAEVGRFQRPAVSWPAMTDETTWLTPSAYKKLQEEYEYMTTTGRREISERIAEARSHGDLKENADYDAAKNEQGLQEAKIRKIRHTLDNAVVREAEDDGTVQIGTVVTLRDADGDEDEYFVASPENKVSGYLLASPSGPLGAALVGASVGDSVTYEAPAGSFTVTVIGIRPYEG